MIWRIAFVFMLYCNPAVAETLRVITGDHSGFTRVVVLTGRDIGVTLEETEDVIVLAFGAGPHRFDLSNAFQKIGRNRISEITADEQDRLRIKLACPCRPVLGSGGPGIVTLDISDAVTDPLSSTSTAPVIASVASTRKVFQNPVLQFGPAMLRPTRPPVLAMPLLSDGEANLPILPDAETASGLQFQIARAASQGLLTPAQSFVAPGQKATERSEMHKEPDGTSPLRFFESQPGVQVRAETPLGESQTQQAMTDSFGLNNRCSAESEVTMTEWGVSDIFQNDIGNLHRDLFSETGRPDHAAARRLARHYIYFGMGAEARATLKAAGLSGAPDTTLFALAEIVDHGVDRHNGAFKGQAHCRSAAALWAVLAESDTDVAADAEVDAVVQAFTALPWHLKDQLGPVLAQRLRSAGNTPMAETVLRVTKRAVDDGSSALKLEEAEAALAGDSEADAIDLLETVTAENGELSPEALVRMIDIEIAAGRPVSAETALLAESYATEYRDTPIAQDLWRVKGLALAASGQYGKVFDLLSETSEKAMHDVIWSATLSALTRHAEDAIFARWSMSIPTDVRTRLGHDVENAAAERLIKLGFAAAADTYLTGSADGDAGRLRKVLRAQAALALNRPRRAEAELTGLSGQDIDRLRAEARLATGDFAASQSLFGSIDAKQELNDAAFLAGNWQALLDSDNTQVAAFGALALEPPPVVPDPDDAEPLQASRGLLADSERARSVISEMLFQVELRDAEADNQAITE